MLMFHKDNNNKLVELNLKNFNSQHEFEFLKFLNEFNYIACFFQVREFPIGQSELHIIYDIFFINQNKKQTRYNLNIDTNLSNSEIKNLVKTHLIIKPTDWCLSNEDIDYIFKIYNSKIF